MQSKKTTKTLTMKKLEEQKKIISAVFIVLLVLQIIIFYGISDHGSELDSSINQANGIVADVSDAIVSETVREQMRIMLDSTRQAWVQYLSNDKDIELILKVDGKYVFGNPKGDRIIFDPETMEKRKCDEAYYNIFQKGTNKELASQVRPVWNESAVRQVLSVVATPLKAYGPKGFPIIYDAHTGEIIVEESGFYPDTKEILQDNGKRNLNLMWKHPNCQNPDAFRLFTYELMIRRDTDKTSNLISLFSEPNISDMVSAGDFSLYPFGNYNRMFVEKMILPYESVGIEGQDMQITIALSASEQEIYESYKSVAQSYDSIITHLNGKASEGSLFPLISIIISLITIFLAMFMVRLFAYRCKVCGFDSKEDNS